MSSRQLNTFACVLPLTLLPTRLPVLLLLEFNPFEHFCVIVACPVLGCATPPPPGVGRDDGEWPPCDDGDHWHVLSGWADWKRLG